MEGNGRRQGDSDHRDSERELLERLQGAETGPEVPEARRILRSPWATVRVIEELLDRPRLLRSSELRRELAAHPRTPEIAARRLVPTLFWRDLAALSRDLRVRPTIRRAAEISLGERLPGLAVGERIAIARRAGTGVLHRLRFDPNPSVIAALLENPRLTEPMLGPLLSSEQARPAILELISRSRRWGNRHGVRLAICRNPRAPVARVQALLSSLRKGDLRAVATDPRLTGAVRRRARVLLGEDPRG